MKWIEDKKWNIILTYFLSLVILTSFLSLRPQFNVLLCPYPTKQVANYPDGEWGTYTVLTDGQIIFRYRLNFSFPQHESEGNYLRSFRVIDVLPPGLIEQQLGDRVINRTGQDEIDVDVTEHIGHLPPDYQVQILANRVRVRTVRNEVDVTEYFEIISILDEYGRRTLGIIARDIALRNPWFYRDGARLYVEFLVTRIFATAWDLRPDGSFSWLNWISARYRYYQSQIVDLNIPNSFRVVGEFYDGEVFDKTSNTVYTYYYVNFLPCGCYLDCNCCGSGNCWCCD